MSKLPFIFALLITVLMPFSAFADDTFTVAGVQFMISEDVYSSEEQFFETAGEIIEEISERGSDPDLIVFPEYIGVFFQLIGYNNIISDNSTLSGALTEVLDRNPGLTELSDIFTRSTSVIRYLEGWSDLAEKYNTAIVAGSCFVTVEDGSLRNRCFVFDADGKLYYQQDKVFLTDFEREIIGIEAGCLEDADLFRIDGHRLAITICRDTYASEWEEKNEDAFLWIDIKANGEVYDSEQRRSFRRALPARLSSSGVNLGMTVCAVGNYLDLLWQGESTAMYRTKDGLALADISESFDSGDLIFLNIHTRQ